MPIRAYVEVRDNMGFLAPIKYFVYYICLVLGVLSPSSAKTVLTSEAWNSALVARFLREKSACRANTPRRGNHARTAATSTWRNPEQRCRQRPVRSDTAANLAAWWAWHYPCSHELSSSMFYCRAVTRINIKSFFKKIHMTMPRTCHSRSKTHPRRKPREHFTRDSFEVTQQTRAQSAAGHGYTGGQQHAARLARRRNQRWRFWASFSAQFKYSGRESSHLPSRVTTRAVWNLALSVSCNESCILCNVVMRYIAHSYWMILLTAELFRPT